MLRHTLNPARIRLPLVLLLIVVFYSAFPLPLSPRGENTWKSDLETKSRGGETLTVRILRGGERLVWYVEE